MRFTLMRKFNSGELTRRVYGERVKNRRLRSWCRLRIRHAQLRNLPRTQPTTGLQKENYRTPRSIYRTHLKQNDSLPHGVSPIWSTKRSPISNMTVIRRRSDVGLGSFIASNLLMARHHLFDTTKTITNPYRIAHFQSFQINVYEVVRSRPSQCRQSVLSNPWAG